MGASVPVFMISTMDASESVAPIHNRMSVVLGSREARHAWLQGEKDVQGLIERTAVRRVVWRLAG